jgi:hypothetical protein
MGYSRPSSLTMEPHSWDSTRAKGERCLSGEKGPQKHAFLRNEPELFCPENSMYPFDLEWLMWKKFGLSIRVRLARNGVASRRPQSGVKFGCRENHIAAARCGKTNPNPEAYGGFGCHGNCIATYQLLRAPPRVLNKDLWLPPECVTSSPPAPAAATTRQSCRLLR